MYHSLLKIFKMFISVCLDICHFMSDLHAVDDKILDITQYYVFLETADAEHEHYAFFSL